ncbi:hypothetical protein GQ85_44015, partial [Rhodococcus rhodochrous]
DELTDRLADAGVTHLVLTPAVLATLDPAAAHTVRVVGVCGEAVPTDLVRRWAPGRTMFNLYGPTEATIWATVAPSPPTRPSPSAPVCPAPKPKSSTAGCGRCRSARPVSCTWPVPGWRAATTAVRS